MTLTFWIAVVEEGARRVSTQDGLTNDALAAIYGGVVGGILGITGALLATFIQRWLQRMGRIRGVIISHSRASLAGQPGVTRFTADVAFYNEKELRIGIREPHLIYLKSGRPVGHISFQHEGEEVPIRFLDLPPREWVNLRGEDYLTGDDAQRMEESDQLRLTWWLPSGKRETREFIGAFDVNWMRRVASRIADAIRVLRGR